jgi:hypothetical protein
MLKSLTLHGIGPVKDLSACFGPRLNVLTGDNGLGKSFLLDVAFWSLTGSWPIGRVALPDPNGKREKPEITYHVRGKKGPAKGEKTATFDFHTQSWVRPPGRPTMPGLVVYATVDGGFVVWDPARNYWRDSPSGQVERADQPRAYQFPTTRDLENGLEEEGRPICNGLVLDWVNWYYRQSSEPQDAPFALLKQVIAQLAHPDEPMQPGKPRRVYADVSREYPTIEMAYGPVAYPHLAAGVRRIINLAYLLVWTWQEHQQAAAIRNEDPTDRLILLVDEVEAHLHPKWQRVILPSLLKVAEGLRADLQVQLLTATHSPLVLASLEPRFDEERDRVFWFDLEGQKVHFRCFPWTPQGDVVGWLTSDVFGLRRARSWEAEQAIEAAYAFLRGDRDALPDGLQTREEIQQALTKTLPNLDPFWPQWLVETKR